MRRGWDFYASKNQRSTPNNRTYVFFPLSRAAIAIGASLIFCSVAVAQQEKPAPKIAALLPPARTSKGLQLQITDAGFGSIKGDGSFYFSYDVTAPDKNLDAEQLDDAVALISLFAPDGTPLMNTDYQGKRTYSSEVSPAWKSVRAEFEVRDSARPNAATGRALSQHKFQVMELPTLPPAKNEETTAQLPVEFKTERGSQLRLEKLTRKKSGSGTDSALVAHWKFMPPPDAPEVEASFENGRAIYIDAGGKSIGEPTTFSIAANKNGEIGIELSNLPNEARGVAYTFELRESARRWRASDASERVSFEIPVAALWKIAPLPLQVPRVAVVKNRNESFEASWEMRDSERDDNPQVRLWLRVPNWAPALDGEVWTIKGATLREKDGQSRNLFGSTQDWHSVFHTDNSLMNASESSVGFSLYNPESLAETDDVTVTAQRARTILKTHVLPLVPLPKRNDTIEFGPKEIFDGVWYLRRITWIDDGRLKDNLEFSDGAGLLLTFDMAPDSYLAEDDMQLNRQIFYDEKGTFDVSRSTFNEGDPNEKGHDEDRITMILSPPAIGSKSFGGNFQVFQRVWSGPTKTLVLPDVPLLSAVQESQDKN